MTGWFWFHCQHFEMMQMTRGLFQISVHHQSDKDLCQRIYIKCCMNPLMQKVIKVHLNGNNKKKYKLFWGKPPSGLPCNICWWSSFLFHATEQKVLVVERRGGFPWESESSFPTQLLWSLFQGPLQLLYADGLERGHKGRCSINFQQ